MAHSLLHGEHIRKIGIVRGGRMGEFFLTYPALAAVRNRYPDAELVLFGDDWQKGFLQHYPDVVDGVEVLPMYAPFDRAIKEPSLKRFINHMAKEQFDLILQLQDDGADTNPLVRAMSPRISAGYAALEAEPLDVTLPYVTHQHETLRAFELLSVLGIDGAALQPSFPLKPTDHTGYADYYHPDGREVIILNPGADDPRHRWSPEAFAEVGDYFSRQGFRIIITASIIEHTIAESVLYVMEEPAEALVGVLSLPAMLALFSKARLVISNDTGPLYAAQAVGAATVGLFWGLNLLHAGPLFGRRHRTLTSWQLHCPQCGDDTLFDEWPQTLPSPGGCKHDRSLLDEIEPADVIDTTERLLLDTVTGLSM